MRVLKWYAPTDQQEITDIALHYVFEAEPGAKEYTIFASENPDFVNAETVHVLQKDVCDNVNLSRPKLEAQELLKKYGIL